MAEELPGLEKRIAEQKRLQWLAEHDPEHWLAEARPALEQYVAEQKRILAEREKLIREAERRGSSGD